MNKTIKKHYIQTTTKLQAPVFGQEHGECGMLNTCDGCATLPNMRQWRNTKMARVIVST